MCNVFADNRTFVSGSKMTMSASEPGAIVPLRGNRPKIFAGDVEVSSTNRFSEMRPGRTPPSYTRLMRVSMPGAPFGIFEKSPLPRTFCSFMQKGQWSVEIACRSLNASPRHSCSCVSLGRSGGLMTYFAPSNPGSS